MDDVNSNVSRRRLPGTWRGWLFYVVLLFVLAHVPAALQATIGEGPYDNSVWSGSFDLMLQIWLVGMAKWGAVAFAAGTAVGAAAALLVAVSEGSLARGSNRGTVRRVVAIALAVGAAGAALTLWFAVGMAQTG